MNRWNFLQNSLNKYLIFQTVAMCNCGFDIYLNQCLDFHIKIEPKKTTKQNQMKIYFYFINEVSNQDETCYLSIK